MHLMIFLNKSVRVEFVIQEVLNYINFSLSNNCIIYFIQNKLLISLRAINYFYSIYDFYMT